MCDEMNILWPNDCIFSDFNNIKFLSTTRWPTSVYISCFQNSSLFCCFDMQGCFCMICIYAWHRHGCLCIWMCFENLRYRVQSFIKIGWVMGEILAFIEKMVGFGLDWIGLVWSGFSWFGSLSLIKLSSMQNLKSIGHKLIEILALLVL